MHRNRRQQNSRKFTAKSRQGPPSLSEQPDVYQKCLELKHLNRSRQSNKRFTSSVEADNAHNELDYIFGKKDQSDITYVVMEGNHSVHVYNTTMTTDGADVGHNKGGPEVQEYFRRATDGRLVKYSSAEFNPDPNVPGSITIRVPPHDKETVQRDAPTKDTTADARIKPRRKQSKHHINVPVDVDETISSNNRANQVVPKRIISRAQSTGGNGPRRKSSKYKSNQINELVPSPEFVDGQLRQKSQLQIKPGRHKFSIVGDDNRGKHANHDDSHLSTSDISSTESTGFSTQETQDSKARSRRKPVAQRRKSPFPDLHGGLTPGEVASGEASWTDKEVTRYFSKSSKPSTQINLTAEPFQNPEGTQTEKSLLERPNSFCSADALDPKTHSDWDSSRSKSSESDSSFQSQTNPNMEHFYQNLHPTKDARRCRTRTTPKIWKPPCPRCQPFPGGKPHVELGRKDHIRDNILRTMRVPPKIPIPQIVDDHKGHTTNWCDSGLAKNYIGSADYGKVPDYIYERKCQLYWEDVRLRCMLNKYGCVSKNSAENEMHQIGILVDPTKRNRFLQASMMGNFDSGRIPKYEYYPSYYMKYKKPKRKGSKSRKPCNRNRNSSCREVPCQTESDLLTN